VADSNLFADSADPFSWALFDGLSFTFEVPIAEWANSSAVMSDKELLNETEVFRAHRSGTQSITSSSPTDVIFNTVDFGNSANFDTGTGIWTAPKTGRIQVNFHVRLASYNANEFNVMSIVKNSTVVSETALIAINSGVPRLGHSDFIDVQKGDTIKITVDSDVDTSYSLTGNPEDTFMSIGYMPDFTVYGAYFTPLKTQTKYLTSDVTSDQTMSDLTFSNLTIGQWYEFSLVPFFDQSSADGALRIEVVHDSASIARVGTDVEIPGGVVDKAQQQAGITKKFKATATTLTFSATNMTAGDTIFGDGTDLETWVQLSEIQPHQETNEW
jgi:hypothetical protein